MQGVTLVPHTTRVLLLVVMVLTRDPHHSLLRLGRTKCRKTCIFTYRIQRRRGSTNKQEGAILLRECRMPWVPVVAYTLVLSCQRAPQGWGEPRAPCWGRWDDEHIKGRLEDPRSTVVMTDAKCFRRRGAARESDLAARRTLLERRVLAGLADSSPRTGSWHCTQKVNLRQK